MIDFNDLLCGPTFALFLFRFFAETHLSFIGFPQSFGNALFTFLLIIISHGGCKMLPNPKAAHKTLESQPHSEMEDIKSWSHTETSKQLSKSDTIIRIVFVSFFPDLPIF